MDKFPEAFRRFESKVDIGKFTSYREFTTSFRWWSGPRWKGTPKQWQALNKEIRNVGFEVPEIYGIQKPTWQSVKFTTNSMNKAWREEVITINGKSQSRYRDIKTGRFIKQK